MVIPFLGYPILWLLGLAAIAWPLGAALAVAVWTLQPDTRLKVPRLFNWWIAFMCWVVLSGVAISSFGTLDAYLYRFVMYVSATILFLFVYNSPRDLLSPSLVIKSLAGFWVAIAIGGLIGVLFPTLEFTTPVERLLPASAMSNGLVANLVHVEFAAVARFLGYPVGRPEALFPFTNAWGSNFALTMPMLLAAASISTRWRRWSQPLLLLATVPVVFSLNRGLWLTVVVGVGVAGLQLALAGRGQAVLGIIAGAVVIGAVGWAFGLGSLVADRAETGHSDEGRLSLYTQAIEAAAESPLLGHGSPQPNVEKVDGPSVGTHGQFWLVLVSQGLPGILFFLGFLVSAALATRRWMTDAGIWSNAVVVVVLAQLFFYEQLASQIQVLMVVVAMSLRELAVVHADDRPDIATTPRVSEALA